MTLRSLIQSFRNWLIRRPSALKPVELSFSRLQAYQRCPWLYHLVYNLGWRSGPNASMALGQSLHRTLAAYLNRQNTVRTQERLMEIYDQNWVNEGFSNTQETLDKYDEGRKMLQQFFMIDSARTSTVIETEMEFKIDLPENIIFRGTVDRLDRAADGAMEIVEYKTQGDHWSDARMSNDLQMTLYSLGIQKIYPEAQIRLKYYFLSSGNFTPVQRDPEQKETAMKLMRDAAQHIRNGEFPAQPAFCGRCEFARRCENYQKP